MRLIPIALLLSVAACAQTQQPGRTSTAIAMTEVALTATEKAATAYIRLPQCTAATRPPCSEASVVARIKSADTVAYNAVMAARSAGDDAKLAAAAAAISALSDLIPIAATH